MKSLIAVAVAAVAATSFVGVAIGSAGGGKLKCFADSPATCTLNSATSATIDTTGGGDAGVYLSNAKSTNGTPLANADFSFTYFCSTTTDISQCTGGGAPRWSIPIDTDGNTKTTEAYAFLDGANCLTGGTALSGGALTVSTAESTCPVFFGSGSYPNWDAFAAANPTYTISGDVPFVISDVQVNAQTIVSDVTVTKS